MTLPGLRRACLRGMTFARRNGLLRQLAVKSRDFCDSHNAQSSPEKSFYDVVISGGGMVGAAMAAALGHEPLFQGQKILLLEAGPQKTLEALPEKYSNRVSALSNSTVDLLTGFGAWENVLNMRCQPVKRMQVWDSCTDSMIAFNQKDLTDDLACIVENDVILSSIYQQIHKVKENVDVRYRTKVKGYKFPSPMDSDGTHWSEINLESGETIQARLLIGADGYKSLVRQTADIHALQWDYNQWAVVATLSLTEGLENNVAWQRFLTTGPIALLPLSDTMSSLVWSTTPEHAKNLVKLPKDTFVDAVNNAFWSDDQKDPRAEYISQAFDNLLNTAGLESGVSRQFPPTVIQVEENSRAMFPLGLMHATHYVKTRLALIGDAAHRIHPLAGQGVNLGFGDVTSLTKVLTKAQSEGTDIGMLPHLLKYETDRQRQVLPVAATIDGLQRLYSTDWLPVVVLRSLGLQATHALGPIKDRIIGGAAGR